MGWVTIFKKHGLMSLFKDIMYRMDWRKPDYNSVKDYLDRNIKLGYQLKKERKIPTFKGTYDEIVIKSFKWVVKNIRYKRDKDNFGTVEMWEDIDIILNNKSADCESMATLVLSIAIANGVNPAKVWFCAGDVKTSKGSGGHAWMEYDADYDYEFNNSYIIDPAYDPRNVVVFDKRQRAKEDKRYIRHWFKISAFNLS